MKRRLLACIMTLVMMLSLLPTAVWAADTGNESDPEETEDTAEPTSQSGEGETTTPVNAADGKLDLDDGSIVISATGYTQGDEETEIGYEGAYIISQTSEESTTHTITVTGGDHTITLNGVNVDVSSQTGTAACAFSIEGDSDVTLVLADGTANSFTSGNSVKTKPNPATGSDWSKATSYAGIAVNEETSLTITGSGSLNATADTKQTMVGDPGTGAGIGANSTTGDGQWTKNQNGCGNITIKSGTVTAISAKGCGIGGGKSAAKVTIDGGNVTATGGQFGCGIGSSVSVKRR